MTTIVTTDGRMRSFDPFATSRDGTDVIEPSKAYAIATPFLLERDMGADQVLVVTFTEATAAESRNRLRSRLRAAHHACRDDDGSDPVRSMLVRQRKAAGHGERLSLSRRSFYEAPISIIHGFCNRAHHDSTFEGGVAFDTQLVIDDEPIVDQVLRDLLARELYASDARFVRHPYDPTVVPSRPPSGGPGECRGRRCASRASDPNAHRRPTLGGKRW